MDNKLYDSNGNYRGFLKDENIYNTSGKFVGFIDTVGDVYASSGRYVGVIVDDCVVEDLIHTKVPKGARFATSVAPTTAPPRNSILLSSRYRDGFDILEE